jgi:hypothetical protein
MPTYKTPYSEVTFGADGSDQMNNVDIGPKPMDQVLNLSEAWLEKNSDFSRALRPTKGTKQDSARLDVVVPVEARFIDGELPAGQKRGKPFKWS